MDRRAFLAAAAAMAVNPGAAWANLDMTAISAEATGTARSPRDKVEAVIQWTHDHLDWTATDYVTRTPEQIVERGGGNCNDQALVVRALLTPAGVRTRRTREVNIQPLSPSREENSERLMASRGLMASVFGLRHNDHVWIEFEDVVADEWRPADPTINLLDFEQWTTARMGFGARPRHEIIPFADMEFPIGIVALHEDGRFENRSHRYLVQSFGRYVNGAAASPQWRHWVDRVQVSGRHVKRAFENHYDLHQDKPLMDDLIATYEGMKTWALAHV